MEPELKDILDTEKKAKQAIEKAVKEKASRLSDAKEQAMQDITAAKKEIDHTKDAVLGKEEQRIATERKNMLQRGKHDVDALESKSKSNEKKAAAFVLEQFEKQLR